MMEEAESLEWGARILSSSPRGREKKPGEVLAGGAWAVRRRGEGGCVPGGALSVESQGQKEACRSEKGMVGRRWEGGLETEVV